MSLLGFDAIGRFAIAQNPINTSTVIYGGSFHIWPQAPKPVNFAKDWVAFAGHPQAGQFPGGYVFSVFDPAPRPRNFARDWIAFSGNVFVETLPISSVFSNFDPPAKPPHHAVDWVAFSGNFFVETRILNFFTPFSPGQTRKLWTRYGQQPQWWTYEFKAPIAKKKDTHDYGWPIRQYHRPHPVVYSEDYYEALKPLAEPTGLTEEPSAPVERTPNLLIPLTRLHAGVHLPSLTQPPPHRPVPTLTMNPPPFRMRTPAENTIDDAAIIRMLLED